MSAKFTSKRGPFNKKNEEVKDMILGHMAVDIVRMAKMKAPVANTKASGNKRGGGGHLQSAIMFVRVGMGSYRVSANKSYAAYQERGMRADGTRRVKKYTTPGTGKHYFKEAIDKAWQNRHNYVQEAKRAVGL